MLSRVGVASRALGQRHHAHCVIDLQLVRSLRILAADPVDPICAKTFADAGHKLVEKKLTQQQLVEQIPGYDGLVVRSGVRVTEEVSCSRDATASSGALPCARGKCCAHHLPVRAPPRRPSRSRASPHLHRSRPAPVPAR